MLTNELRTSEKDRKSANGKEGERTEAERTLNMKQEEFQPNVKQAIVATFKLGRRLRLRAIRGAIPDEDKVTNADLSAAKKAAIWPEISGN